MGTTNDFYRETNKVGSILFVDMVGSSEIMASSNIDEARTCVLKTLNVIKELAVEYGGQVISTQGDGAKIGFGLNGSIEDHADRAVLTATEIVKSCNLAQSGKSSIYRGLRAGINSGFLIYSEDQKNNSADTYGITTNIAAKLQAAAPVNQICISEKTYSLLKRNIRAKRFKLVSVGKSAPPVPSYVIDVEKELNSSQSSKFNSETPLVGRADELEEIRNVLNFSSSNTLSSIILVGEAGIGKSRIIEDVVNELHVRSILQLTLSGIEAMAKTPFYAIKQIADQLYVKLGLLNKAETNALKIVQSLDPSKIKDWKIGEIDKVNLIFSAPLKIIQQSLTEGHLVLIIEDLHFFDQESLRFIEKILQFSQDQPSLKIVASSRPNITNYDFRLYDKEISLSPLKPGDAINLAKEIATNIKLHFNQTALNDVVSCSRGLPLAIVELTKLELTETAWANRENIPVSIEPVLKKRIENLSTDSRRLTNFLSLLESIFTKALFIKMTGWTYERATSAINEAKKSGIVIEVENNKLLFSHDLFRIACNEALTSKTRKTYHKTIYTVLKDELPTKPTIPETQMLAQHAFGAEENAQGIIYFKQALGMANDIGAIRTVRKIFIEACEFVGVCENPSYLRAKFAMLSFDATHRLTEEINLIDIYKNALEQHEPEFTPHEKIVLKSQLSIILWTSGFAEQGLIYASDAFESLKDVQHLGLEYLAVYALASLEFARGFIESAIDRINSYLTKIPKELRAKKWGQSASLPSIVLQTYGAWFAIDAGKLELAENYLSLAEDTKKDFPTTYADVLIKITKGYYFLRTQKFVEGAQVLTEAYEIASKSAISLATMSAARAALCMIEIGQSEDALALLNQELSYKRIDRIRNTNRGYILSLIHI